METHKRTIAKTASFRLLATIITMGLILMFTGNWLLASGIGALEATSKIVVYYFHERAWNKVSWGKNIQ